MARLTRKTPADLEKENWVSVSVRGPVAAECQRWADRTGFWSGYGEFVSDAVREKLAELRRTYGASDQTGLNDGEDDAPPALSSRDKPSRKGD